VPEEQREREPLALVGQKALTRPDGGSGDTAATIHSWSPTMRLKPLVLLAIRPLAACSLAGSSSSPDPAPAPV
ncbi:hypothetical protein AAGG60_22050, partial [Stenotrophomonas maltophilia]